MNKTRPYIICHMMASLDGRIDCTMTSKLSGVDTYYRALSALDMPTTVSGKTTAEMELTSARFSGDAGALVGKETFYRAETADGYSVITDTRGALGWRGSNACGKPLLVLLSEQAGENYLAYLKGKGISYMENQVGWHGKAPDDAQCAHALAELDAEEAALRNEGHA